MRQFILISVFFLTSMYAQKSNHKTTIDREIKNQRHETESILENVPRRLSYQGLLTKVDGKAVTNGTYQVTFRLFESLMGGEPFWEEEQNIIIADGVVSATLGSVTPISGVPSNAYLEIEINGSALSPRQEMTSVFYSVVSDTAKYAQAGNYMNLNDRPDLNVFVEKDSLSQYPLKNELDSVAFSGSYSHLIDVPNLDAFVSADTLSNFVQKDSLGSISDQNYDNVNITGGDIQGITDLAIADGGTGASDNSTARSNLGLEIGVDIQAYDADLADLADGTLSAEKVEFLNNVTSDVQSQINAIADDHIHTLEDLNVTASSEELNYVQGVTSDIQGQLDDKQDINANLTAIADLTHNHDHFIVSDGATWTVRSGPDARLSLGLGSIATQASDNVSITGGSLTDIEDIAVADGGTGASDVTTARSNLGLEIGVDIQAYDDDLADLAEDGILSASKVQYAITSEGSSGQVWTSDGDGTGVWGEPGTLTGAGSTIDAEDLTASRALVSNASGKVGVSEVTDTELGYLDGVTSTIQTQIDGKQAADDDLSDLADGTLSASKVENNEYFITSAGTNGQVWTSDGDGAGAWVANSAATNINGLTDALVEDDGSMYVGNDPSSSTDGADYNVAVGTTALDAVTTGYSNTALGYNSLTENLIGNRNTAVGSNALKSNTSGITNVAVGSSALERNTTANSNTAVGHASSFLLNSGQNNVSLGYESSKNMTNSNQNVIIGADANPSAEAGTANQVVLGYGTTGKANNTVTIGNGDITGWFPTDDNEVDLGSSSIEFKDIHLDGVAYADGITLENGETITNSTDGTVVIDGKTDFNDNALTGYGADLQTESGTSKTLAASDNGTIIVCSSNSAVTITVPASLPSGFNCMIIQNGSGQVSLSASSTTLNNRNGSKTAGQYAILTLVHLGSNVFVVSGDTSS